MHPQRCPAEYRILKKTKNLELSLSQSWILVEAIFYLKEYKRINSNIFELAANDETLTDEINDSPTILHHTSPFYIIVILHLYCCLFLLQEMFLLILFCAHLARGDPFISPTRTERSSLRQCQDHGIRACNKVGWPFFQFEVAKNLKTLIFTDSRNRVSRQKFLNSPKF